MPQYPLNIPAGVNLSAAITTGTTGTPVNTAIQTGVGAKLAGYVCTNAGSAWTLQAYDGDPAASGTAVGPAVTVTTGFVVFPVIRFPNGLYVQTKGTTAGSLQVAYY